MPAVYLLRHGQASFGGADYDVLSSVGERQATVLGAELNRREVPVQAVWSGTLRRQVDTATGCLAELGVDLPVRQDSRWDEYDHLGLVAGGHGEVDPADPAAAARIFQERLDESLRAWLTDGRPVGAMGTWAEFTGRITQAVADAVAGVPRGGAALVFTSAGVISAVCAGLLHLPPAGYLSLNRTMANASITKLVDGRSGTSLVSVNEHGHFEGPHRELLTYR